MEIDRKTGNKNIYRYKFDMAAPPNKSHWGSQASHADDIEYVFGTLDTQPGVVWRPEDYALSEQMMSYWTNFARTGDPNGIDGNGQRLPRSTPDFHRETGNARKMLEVIRDQNHSLRYRV